MKTRLFNVFALIANILATLTCIASVALMAAEEKLNIFLTASFYITIFTFITCFIGMQYNVRSYNLQKSITPKWYIVFRLAIISSLVINSLLSFAFTDSGAWAIPYFLTRLVLPLLLIVCFIFFDVDIKVPFAAVCAAPAYFVLYFVIFLPLFGLEILVPPYEFLDVANNAWTVTFLLVIGTIACSILVAATLRALNFSIHYAAYGKYEQEERIKKLALQKQQEEVQLKDLNEVINKGADEEIVEEDVTEVISEPEIQPVEEIDTDTKINKKVKTETASIKKVEEPIKEEIIDTPTVTKTIKKVNTNTARIKKVETGTIKKVTDTRTIKKVKTDTQTNTIKKVEPNNSINQKAEDYTRVIKKVDTSTTKINKVDTTTKFINKLGEEINRVYHVSHHKTLNKWQVKLAGSNRALKLFKTQLDAINYAKELTKTRGGSIRIHSVNGTIRKG